MRSHTMKTRRFKIGSVSVLADIEPSFAWATATAGPAYTGTFDRVDAMERQRRLRREMHEKIAARLKLPPSMLVLDWQAR